MLLLHGSTYNSPFCSTKFQPVSVCRHGPRIELPCAPYHCRAGCSRACSPRVPRPTCSQRSSTARRNTTRSGSAPSRGVWCSGPVALRTAPSSIKNACCITSTCTRLEARRCAELRTEINLKPQERSSIAIFPIASRRKRNICWLAISRSWRKRAAFSARFGGKPSHLCISPPSETPWTGSYRTCTTVCVSAGAMS